MGGCLGREGTGGRGSLAHRRWVGGWVVPGQGRGRGQGMGLEGGRGCWQHRRWVRALGDIRAARSWRLRSQRGAEVLASPARCQVPHPEMLAAQCRTAGSRVCVFVCVCACTFPACRPSR